MSQRRFSDTLIRLAAFLFACKPVYAHARQCMFMYTCVNPCTPVYAHEYPCSHVLPCIYTSVCPSTPAYTHVSSCMSIYTKGMTRYTDVYLCTPVYAALIPVYAYVTLCMPMYSSVYPSKPMYTNVRQWKPMDGCLWLRKTCIRQQTTSQRRHIVSGEISHSPRGFSGPIYNTVWGTLAILLVTQFTVN